MARQAISALSRLGDPSALDANGLFILGESLRSLDRFEEAIDPLRREPNPRPETSRCSWPWGGVINESAASIWPSTPWNKPWPSNPASPFGLQSGVLFQPGGQRESCITLSIADPIGRARLPPLDRRRTRFQPHPSGSRLPIALPENERRLGLRAASDIRPPMCSPGAKYGPFLSRTELSRLLASQTIRNCSPPKRILRAGSSRCSCRSRQWRECPQRKTEFAQSARPMLDTATTR